MNFHILTLFPEMVTQTLMTSITGRAVHEGTISVEAVNIRDFSQDKHKKTDDYTYGGGAGMLMQAQPVFDAYEHVAARIPEGRKKRVIYVTPQGTLFQQRMAEELAECEELIFLCGHYEGVDERVLEEIVTDYVSIGDYVLTGGELAAMVMVDAIARLVPGVLHNDESAETESFHQYLLEYPQYSRPEVWRGKAVPKVLLSGNPKEVAAWRLEESKMRTKARRPELYEKYEQLASCREFLMKEKLLCIDMIAAIDRGNAELVSWERENVLLYDFRNRTFLLYAGELDPAGHEEKNIERSALEKLFPKISDRADRLVIHIKTSIGKNGEECLIDEAAGDRTAKPEAFGSGSAEFEVSEFYHAVYTRKEQLSIAGLYRADGQENEQGVLIRQLTGEEVEVFLDIWNAESAAEQNEAAHRNRSEEQIEAANRNQSAEQSRAQLRKCALRGNLAGAWRNGAPAGFAGIFPDGRIGELTVFPKYRRKHIGKALATYVINRVLQQGFIPYARIEPANDAGFALQESLGMYLSKKTVAFLQRL